MVFDLERLLEPVWKFLCVSLPLIGEEEWRELGVTQLHGQRSTCFFERGVVKSFSVLSFFELGVVSCKL